MAEDQLKLLKGLRAAQIELIAEIEAHETDAIRDEPMSREHA